MHTTDVVAQMTTGFGNRKDSMERKFRNYYNYRMQELIVKTEERRKR